MPRFWRREETDDVYSDISYPEELLSNSVKAVIVSPTGSVDVTDSKKHVPDSLFEAKASNKRRINNGGSKEDASLNKRRQIDRSGRVMFGWVAGASVLVGFALVIGGFLVQRIVFETKVLAEKNQTTSTLDSNIKTYDGLRDNIRVLKHQFGARLCKT